ncbi:S4 domain protein [Dictyocaulus viviparus]|uniref:S4 domain protein n=1 Tax=Dictyocaulus viviparus TaxID=29172 RepID=A0A0D8X8N6_DICVI|nr:S4 domain protein [Dictyocaulus viviparus]
MGKTERGAVWLDSNMLSPYDYWQYFRNIDDQDATEVTKICHGKKEAEIAQSAAVSAFENEDSSLLPDYIITKEQVINGISLVNLLHNTGLKPSKSAVKRLIQGNECKVSDNTINDVNYIINLESFKGQPFIKLSAGRKRHIKVVVG